MPKPLLVAFDFDHTIVDENTDIVVRKLISNDRIPPDVKQLYQSDGWTLYMQQIFNLLHSNGIDRQQITNAIQNISVTTGFNDLLTFLGENKIEVIIISDSNSVFIQDWLKGASLENTIKTIFTNPAHYNTKGCLEIDMYHVQNWCMLSTKNLCKGHILENYIKDRVKEGVTFSRTAYVGDGKNDLCPSLHLAENDMIFPRLGYSLIDSLKDHENTGGLIKASIHPWCTGHNIKDILFQYVT